MPVMFQTPHPKNRKILSRSILISSFLHVLAIFFLQRNSLWFSPRPDLEKQSQKPWVSSMEMAKRQQILKETFESSQIISSSKPIINKATSIPEIKWEVKPIQESPTIFATATIDPPLLSLPAPSLSTPASQSMNLFEYLPKNLILPKVVPQKEPFAPATLPNAKASLQPTEFSYQEKEIPTLPIHPESLISSWNFHPEAVKPTTFPQPSMPKLPTLAELHTISYSDAFDAELVFLPQEDRGGYVFALTLIPRIDLELPKLKQHYLFLIDRSNSIQSDRLFATKNAILRALDDLKEDDFFNIVAFDSKLDKMAPIEMRLTPQTKAKAEAFLETIKLGSFFSGADLSKALLTAIPSHVDDDEIYSALLFTDGEILAKKGAQREILYNWTYFNGGRVSLFPIALSSDAHLATLDTAAMFNKGKLFCAPTFRGIKRKTLKAMKTIHTPVAKNLQSKAIPLTPQTHVELHPKASHCPHLYLNEPYVIIGTCDTLDDFILFLQGRLHNRWLNIKKRISFLNAKKGGQSLKSEWALQIAYRHYEAFLQDGNMQHLTEAHHLLDPHNIQVALE